MQNAGSNEIVDRRFWIDVEVATHEDSGKFVVCAYAVNEPVDGSNKQCNLSCLYIASLHVE